MAFVIDDDGRVYAQDGAGLTDDPRRNAYNSGLIAGADGYVYDMPTLMKKGGGGSGGTTDHSHLTNRDAVNQHPMSAITGLTEALGEQSSAIDTLETQIGGLSFSVINGILTITYDDGEAV